MSFLEKIVRWLGLYLLAAGTLSTIFAVFALLFTIYPTKTLETLLFWVSIIAPTILMAIGAVSLLPLSEYVYTRQAGINPTVARESLEHYRRKPERREFGILLGIVGLTSLLGINPWNHILFLLGPRIGTPLIVILLASLFMVYRRLVLEPD